MTDPDSRLLLAQADDRTVAGRAADGDVDAFTTLVRRYTPLLRAYARRILGATASVDDIVQEAFVTAWQKLPELEQPAKVRSWLMRIVSRNAISELRATRPHLDLDDAPERTLATPLHEAPPATVERRAELAALAEALGELPAAQRECWVLREVGGHSYEEIAEDLDIPVSTVRGLLARARRYIITRMEEWR
ncbi:RNA polymerase sigma-70 factor (ECF subfamily) [Microbacterium resistens]|uniref:RNA polymerase sigma factor n=1 Tax=Microbacterium resistens TaxID=156977 RepID=A0ABU1SEH4_9MICO|nr:RNA polymerase sigma factor [Microbacterium resistens]MDR6868010.1 RNA polymerase sigma-70 factor (ECF subfamily) [Microbacterium resistens]